MKMINASYTVTVSDKELDVICEAIKHLRLDREICSARPDLVNASISILNELKKFLPKAQQVNDELIKDYEKQCDELMGE
jgi:hypothetical protein